jgi:hypothetical protein
MKRLLLLSLPCVAAGFSSFAAAQARPFPGPDVQQIYQRLLPQIEKIPASTTMLIPALPTIRMWTPWPRLPIPAFRCARVTITLN